MIRKILLTATAALLAALSAAARGGFAIVIDPKSYAEARAEVEAYAAAVRETDGLTPHILVDRWGVPDSIRAALRRMHDDSRTALEGCVLVGDIPVAMIRDAQHLTSAFKMNQKMDRRRSSVPSDRFYDDFGLQFTPLGRDEGEPYFYYSLAAEGEQRLEPDLYSGRIRPTDVGGTSRYEKLRRYLRKLVAEKRARPQLRRIFFFSGHGYISESRPARMDEKAGLYEHFPMLRGQREAIGYMDHSDVNPVKEHLMNELMRDDLDFALLHHHGQDDTQYLNEIAMPRMPRQAREWIKAYCRARLQAARERGRNADSLRTVLEGQYDLPASWLEGWDAPALLRADSLRDAALDLHLEDFAGYGFAPNCRVVMIDACFCGSFHLDDCIANEYIFSPGRTVVCIANSVNVLQDKWSDRLVGLMAMGGCVGDVVRYSTYLESHVVGDPTFRFADEQGRRLDELIRRDRVADWKKLLRAPEADLQVLAIEHLHRHGAIGSDELLDIFRTSTSALVRMQALQTLSQINDANFIEAIRLGVDDSYELVQRHALRLLGCTGDTSLVPALIGVCIRNNTSERCNFNARTALSYYTADVLLPEFARQFDSPTVKYVHKDTVRAVIEKSIRHNAGKWTEDMDLITAPDTPQKQRLSAIRTLRNNCVHACVPRLVAYLRSCPDAATQVALLEALGWHRLSTGAPLVRRAALDMSRDTGLAPEVRHEALKTYNRLK